MQTPYIKIYIIMFHILILSLSIEDKAEQSSGRQDDRPIKSQIYSPNNKSRYLQQSQQYCLGSCLECNPQNPAVCFTCRVGFVLMTNGVCIRCQLGCMSCSSPYYCTLCVSGFDLMVRGQIAVCLQCSTGCQKCQVLPFTSGYLMEVSTCSVCYPSFYLAQSTSPFPIEVCNPCIPGCYQCSSKDDCSFCFAGYGYNKTSNTCYVCGGNCSSCNDQGCLYCNPGYYVEIVNSTSELSCFPCMINCISCGDANTCLNCEPGYYVAKQNSSNQTIYYCVACQFPCLVCYSQTICLACAKSYFLQVNGTNVNSTVPIIQSAQCLLCSADCQVCTNASVCIKCPYNYFINGDGICQSCPETCLQCYTATKCSECIQQHYLDNGLCQPCGWMCDICEPVFVENTTVAICVNCISTQYAPVGGSSCALCTDVSEACLTCLTPQICLSCIDGYYLDDKVCLESYQGLAPIYIVLIVIASLIGVGAIGFAIWACWRYKNGYGVGSQRIGDPGIRASYYQIP